MRAFTTPGGICMRIITTLLLAIAMTAAPSELLSACGDKKEGTTPTTTGTK